VLSTGSSITAAGITAVTGDVGATSLTGGGTLNITAGTDYATLGTGQPYVDAKTDLPLVIADATSTTLFPCVTATTIAGGDLAGVTLVPGVTCILNDAAISNTGIVTLNGPGVYIIRTNAALTAQGPSGVAYMVGSGATDANTTVFWVVQSVVFTSTTGSPVTWKGNLLATTGAVTLGGYATLTNGRVLTTAGVTLTSNTITKP
jgi:Ice-binding-like